MILKDLLLKSNLPIRELTDEELSKQKETLLEIYKDIKFACEKEELNVMLCGGSCLGAVRHKGFIPWDDDMDLAMLRRDYEKLPSALEKAFPGKYRIEVPRFSDKYEQSFMKVLRKGTFLRTVFDYPEEKPEIYIDVFPLDNIPNSKFLRLVHAFLSTSYIFVGLCVKLFQRKDCPYSKAVCSTKEGRKTLRKRFWIGKLFSRKSYFYWYKKADDFSRKYESKNTSAVTITAGRAHYFGEILNKTDIFPLEDCDFESTKGKIYHNYKKYLANLYGDYMRIPPVEKREKHFIVDIDFGEEK